MPGLPEALAEAIARVARSLRGMAVKKPPSVSETIDWARTLLTLGVERIDQESFFQTAHVLLKNLFEASCRALDAGADTLVLGCTGMLGVAAALQDRLESERTRVPVVDPTGASLGMLLSMHSMGLKPSRRTYMPPPDKERASATGD